MPDSSRISPTAHYTSYVWFRHGMSHPALATPLGARLHLALRPMNLVYGQISKRPNLDMMLLARHRVIDKLLERALVIELLLRLSKDLRFISVAQYARAIALTSMIGKQAGGWKKYTASSPASSRSRPG